MVSFPLDARAVAFDLDGTLLDTLPDLAAAAVSMLEALGRPPVTQATVRSYIGEGIGRLTKRLLTGTLEGEPPPELFERALAIFEQKYGATLTQRTRPFPGVEAGLQAFARAGLPLACVTNKAAAFTLPLLEATGLARWFALVVSGDTLPHKKPDPEPFLYCARHFGIEPESMLVIGDSIADVKASRAANCPVACVSYGYSRQGVQELNADAIVRDITEAVSLVRPLEKS